MDGAGLVEDPEGDPRQTAEAPTRARLARKLREMVRGAELRTVSNVVHNRKSRVSEKKVAKIWEIIEREHYVPSMSARSKYRKYYQMKICK